MNTIVIELTSPKTMKLIRDLEELDLLRIIKNDEPEELKLSDKYAGKLSFDDISGLRGKLNLTDGQYDDFQTYLKKTREEWERDI